MEPVRTCIGCRERDEKSALVRVIATDTQVVVDDTTTAAGRGAWLHPTEDCLDQARRRRAFGRALRTDISDSSSLDENLITPKRKAERHMDN